MMTLKTILTINGVSSAGTGFGLILFAKPTAEVFGTSETMAFIGTGIFLVLFAAYVIITAMKKPIDEKAVRLIISLDTGWVIASFILIALAYSTLTTLGIFAISVVAGWVAMMALLQHNGAKILNSNV